MSFSEPILKVKSATKRYGSVEALRDLSITFHSGQITLLLGPNGSGKSTLLRAAAGLTSLDSGAASIACSGARSKPRIGYFGHQCQLYSALTVEENLEFFMRLLDGPQNVRRESAAELLIAWQLRDCAKRPAGELSKGLQSRLSLACAMAGDPDILLLDEPSSALDDGSLQILKDKLLGVVNTEGRRSCVVVATHDLARLQNCAGRAVLLEWGVVRADSAELQDRDAIGAVVELYRQDNR